MKQNKTKQKQQQQNCCENLSPSQKKQKQKTKQCISFAFLDTIFSF